MYVLIIIILIICNLCTYVYTYVSYYVCIFTLDIYYFNDTIQVVTEGDESDATIKSLNLTFSPRLRNDTVVQLRYRDLTAFGNSSA